MNPETRAEIIRLARYLTDDSMIASYVGGKSAGVTKEIVAKLRRQTRFPEPLMKGQGKPSANQEPQFDAVRRDATSAKQGSEALLKALDAYWRKRKVPGPWMQR